MLKIADFDPGYETPAIPAAKTPPLLSGSGFHTAGRREGQPVPVAGRSLGHPALRSLDASSASPSWLRVGSNAGSRARAALRSLGA